MPDSRPNSVGKVYAGLQTKMAQKPYLCGGKNLYALYKGVSPSPPHHLPGVLHSMRGQHQHLAVDGWPSLIQGCALRKIEGSPVL